MRFKKIYVCNNVQFSVINNKIKTKTIGVILKTSDILQPPL